MLKQYEKYKQAKYKWFDNVPANWQEARVSYFFEISRGRVIAETELVEDGLYPVYSSQTKNNGCLGFINTYDFDDKIITWTTDGANAGSVFLREGKFNCTNVCGALKAKKDVSLEYYLYFLQYATQFYKRPDTNGAKIMSNEMAAISILIPTLQEQTQIALYLDYQTNIIDQLISQKQKLIDLLKEKRQAIINEAVTKGLNPNAKMKDSGIEWLGEVPLDWEIVKLKFVSNIKFSSVDRHEYEEENKVSICHYPYVYKNEKINKQLELATGTCTVSELENFSLKKGQIILTKDSETANDIGVPAYVEEDIPNAVCGYHLAMVETKNKDENILPEFLFRYFQTSNVNRYFELSSNGVTRFGLGKPSIENLFVPIPTIEEQKNIVVYLSNSIDNINNCRVGILNVIEKLKEYRQSIISETVTGKIDVRDWKVSES